MHMFSFGSALIARMKKKLHIRQMHISKRKFEIVIAEIVTWQEINCTAKKFRIPLGFFQEVVIMIPETCAHKLL